MRRAIIRVLLVLAAVGALALAAFTMLQDRLLYFPSRATVAQMTSPTLRAWPSEDEFRGLLAEPARAALATAIVFHGNAGHAGDRAFYAAALVPLGVRVLLAEYPAYGPRDGDVGEASFLADARRTLERAHAQFGAPIVVIGESLGAAVAAGAASAQPDAVAGLVLITPWDSLVSAAAHHYPWLPVRWLLRDRYDTRTRLAGFDKPVVIVVAQADTIVPAALGAALAQAKPGARLITVAGAGHNDWPMQVTPAWWRELLHGVLPAR